METITNQAQECAENCRAWAAHYRDAGKGAQVTLTLFRAATLLDASVERETALLTDAARLERALADLALAVKENNRRQANLGDVIVNELLAAMDLLNEIQARSQPVSALRS